MSEPTETSQKTHATRAIEDIMTVGKAWARYGLTVSKMALETSATTLHKTAGWLGDLAQTLGEKNDAQGEKPASEDHPA